MNAYTILQRVESRVESDLAEAVSDNNYVAAGSYQVQLDIIEEIRTAMINEEPNT